MKKYLIFLLLLLFTNSCFFFVRNVKKEYTVAIEMNSRMSVSQSESGGGCMGTGFTQGNAFYFSNEDKGDSYASDCKKALEQELSGDNFEIVPDGYPADIVVRITGLSLSETISTQGDPENKCCYYVHTLDADMNIDLYKKGTLLDSFNKSVTKGQDVVENSKQTGYKVKPGFLNEENLVKRLGRHAAYAIINHIGKEEKRQQVK